MAAQAQQHSFAKCAVSARLLRRVSATSPGRNAAISVTARPGAFFLESGKGSNA